MCLRSHSIDVEKLRSRDLPKMIQLRSGSAKSLNKLPKITQLRCGSHSTQMPENFPNITQLIKKALEVRLLA